MKTLEEKKIDLLTPISEKTTVQTLKELPNRFVTLIWKLLSFKGLGFATAVVLVATGRLSNWYAVVTFLFTFLFAVLGREVFKYLKDIKELKE